jgi:hypothetical protein
MRRLGWAIVLTVLSGSSALAQDKPPVVARAEQCLRDNVERVVAVEPDVQSAASFLVDFVCAPQVSAASRYEVNKTLVRLMVDQANALPVFTIPGQPPAPRVTLTATVDPETGDVVVPPAPAGAAANPFSTMLRNMGSSSLGQAGVQAVSPPLRHLAGDLVLAAREQQLGKAR